MFYLQCDMNLLVYGVGSKYRSMEKFVRDYVNFEWSSVYVRGYHSELAPKNILIDIIDYLDQKIDPKPKKEKVWNRYNTQEMIESIKRKTKKLQFSRNSDQPAYIIILNSMDVGVLKGPEWQ